MKHYKHALTLRDNIHIGTCYSRTTETYLMRKCVCKCSLSRLTAASCLLIRIASICSLDWVLSSHCSPIWFYLQTEYV